MKKIFCLTFFVLLFCSILLVGCGSNECEHVYGEWQIIVQSTCTQKGEKVKYCVKCNNKLSQDVELANHDYSVETIIQEATCVGQGTKKISCSNCSDYKLELYSLESFNATEINNQALKYVGEIITYDKLGNELTLGTGFIYTQDGQIITNYHVIKNAYSANIKINQKIYEIEKVLAYDEEIDLAILKISGTNFEFAKICKKEIPVGAPVFAIGSAKGMTNTFSQGIVTYYNREINNVSYLQHDASITNGNSGGPLINEFGEVVGINTWTIKDSQNLNFAIFTAELDNLVFGKEMTFAEFYELNNPYAKLTIWLMNNYTNYTEDVSLLYMKSNESAVYSLAYGFISDCLYISMYFIFEEGYTLSVSLFLHEDEETSIYICDYGKGSNINTTSGYIYRSSYNSNSTLTYIEYEGNYYDKEWLLDFYNLGITTLLSWFEYTLEEIDINLGLPDFGFLSF